MFGPEINQGWRTSNPPSKRMFSCALRMGSNSLTVWGSSSLKSAWPLRKHATPLVRFSYSLNDPLSAIVAPALSSDNSKTLSVENLIAKSQCHKVDLPVNNAPAAHWKMLFRLDYCITILSPRQVFKATDDYRMIPYAALMSIIPSSLACVRPISSSPP
jgi:hypothetical protein